MNVHAITPVESPVTAETLRQYLRLNDVSEDALLEELLVAACERFEDDTHRPVVSRQYRQYLDEWPSDLRVVLGVGGVTLVSGVKKRLINDGTADLAFNADLFTAPKCVRIATVPTIVVDNNGIPLSPVGYVELTAGWSAGNVPKTVIVALKSLAGYWYENREAYAEGTLAGIANGWERITARYRLGM